MTISIPISLHIFTARIHYSDELLLSDDYRAEYRRQEFASKESINVTPSASPHGSPQPRQRLGHHLSKSASELNGHQPSSPQVSPKRAKSAAAPHTSSSSGSGVLQKTHGFFNNLKHRWGRAKSKDRVGRKSPSDFLEESTDYAADYSSESSSVTQSPRHRSKTIGGSPLAKEFKATARMAQAIQRFGGSMEGRIDEDPENGNANLGSECQVTSKQLEQLQVSGVT